MIRLGLTLTWSKMRARMMRFRTELAGIPQEHDYPNPELPGPKQGAVARWILLHPMAAKQPQGAPQEKRMFGPFACGKGASGRAV